MHVGHLRSTVIGDSLARIIAALGHRVIRDNHLGDWGSQFGMILWGWKNARDESRYRGRSRRRAGAALSPGPGSDQGRRRGRQGGRAGRDGQAPCRRSRKPRPLEPVHAPLPGRAPGALRSPGRPVRRAARRELLRPDARLGRGRSARARGSPSRAKGRSSSSSSRPRRPFIVRKRDGAFNYATTDLATIKYRVETWHPDQILYVVDHRQGDHFKQLFEVARKWGYDSVDLEHVAFGTILGADRRPFKTREGDVVGLESLLDEATAEALKVVEENSPELDPAEQQQVAEVVGLGAIKYADLSQNRISDYVFDWQKMMAMNGNTATYLNTPMRGSGASSARGGSPPRRSADSARRSRFPIPPNGRWACGCSGCRKCSSSPPKSSSRTS